MNAPAAVAAGCDPPSGPSSAVAPPACRETRAVGQAKRWLPSPADPGASYETRRHLLHAHCGLCNQLCCPAQSPFAPPARPCDLARARLCKHGRQHGVQAKLLLQRGVRARWHVPNMTSLALERSPSAPMMTVRVCPHRGPGLAPSTGNGLGTGAAWTWMSCPFSIVLDSLRPVQALATRPDPCAHSMMPLLSQAEASSVIVPHMLHQQTARSTR